MHKFLSNNREALIQRCRAKCAQRSTRVASKEQLQNGVPLFLDRLIATLNPEQTIGPSTRRKISGSPDSESSACALDTSAAKHARELLQLGFSIDQVVHGYGDLYQAIMDLMNEVDASFPVEELRTLNRCLDNAIASAVTEFVTQLESIAAHDTALQITEKIGYLTHDLRSLIGTAMLAFATAKAGNLVLSGATGTVLEHSLFGLRDLIDQSLAETRAMIGSSIDGDVFSVAEFIEEVKFAAELAAHVHGCALVVTAVSPTLNARGDRDLLYSSLGNLIQNAFKFTRPHTEVRLSAYTEADRILIDVADHCGGLPDGDVEKMFLPFTQSANDRSGLGLGLATARQNVELNGGSLSARDLPGIGCVFTISLPRYDMAEG
ncbi:Two-component hybrid sensor and regulator [Caballeronia sordidicola]|jgi:signal transduction histidine kinase|uniref:histidine kinase n=1 Tax=Caballeronia sordidicola TaxID=196367 RepID=A0A226WY32_CABSO|nr:Two-component hybrid sensor and regulator [Caballeronia sordidicola]